MGSKTTVLVTVAYKQVQQSRLSEYSRDPLRSFRIFRKCKNRLIQPKGPSTQDAIEELDLL